MRFTAIAQAVLKKHFTLDDLSSHRALFSSVAPFQCIFGWFFTVGCFCSHQISHALCFRKHILCCVQPKCSIAEFNNLEHAPLGVGYQVSARCSGELCARTCTAKKKRLKIQKSTSFNLHRLKDREKLKKPKKRRNVLGEARTHDLWIAQPNDWIIRI